MPRRAKRGGEVRQTHGEIGDGERCRKSRSVLKCRNNEQRAHLRGVPLSNRHEPPVCLVDHGICFWSVNRQAGPRVCYHIGNRPERSPESSRQWAYYAYRSRAFGKQRHGRNDSRLFRNRGRERLPWIIHGFTSLWIRIRRPRDFPPRWESDIYPPT